MIDVSSKISFHLTRFIGYGYAQCNTARYTEEKPQINVIAQNEMFYES